MDIYVVAYIVLEQLLATSMLIGPRVAGIIRGVEAILHHLLCILYLREILLPRSDMISFEHILYIQNSHLSNVKSALTTTQANIDIRVPPRIAFHWDDGGALQLFVDNIYYATVKFVDK